MTRHWRCFHCDGVYKTFDAAREHFGPHELADPACQIDIKKFRQMETYFERCCAEDSDSDRKFYALIADHARALIREEQRGYDRGLADAREERLRLARAL